MVSRLNSCNVIHLIGVYGNLHIFPHICESLKVEYTVTMSTDEIITYINELVLYGEVYVG